MMRAKQKQDEKRDRRRREVAALDASAQPEALRTMPLAGALFVGLAAGEPGQDPLLALLSTMRVEVGALVLLLQWSPEAAPMVTVLEGFERRLRVAGELRRREVG